MTLALTPARIAAVYEMLRAWPPYSRWKLPAADDVRFHVTKTDRYHAAWWKVGDKHHIEISSKKHGHMDSLVATVAHEMIHIYQHEARTETPNTEHNAQFRTLIPGICRRFGWDDKQFLAG